MKAIVMNSAGGFETLEYVERPDPVAGPGQAFVEVAVAGVNFLDTGACGRARLGPTFPTPRSLASRGWAGSWRWARASRASRPASASPGFLRPEAMPERIAIPAMSSW